MPDLITQFFPPLGREVGTPKGASIPSGITPRATLLTFGATRARVCPPSASPGPLCNPMLRAAPDRPWPPSCVTASSCFTASFSTCSPSAGLLHWVCCPLKPGPSNGNCDFSWFRCQDRYCLWVLLNCFYSGLYLLNLPEKLQIRPVSL